MLREKQHYVGLQVMWPIGITGGFLLLFPLPSSSDDSTKREHSSSPITSKVDPARVHQHPRADRELDKYSGCRSHYGRSGDSYGYSDRHSSRNYCGHSRHDDYTRHENHSHDERRPYQLPSCSAREWRGVRPLSHSIEDIENGRAKEHMRNADKYSHDRYGYSGHRSRDREKKQSSLECQNLKDRDSSP